MRLVSHLGSSLLLPVFISFSLLIVESEKFNQPRVQEPVFEILQIPLSMY